MSTPNPFLNSFPLTSPDLVAVPSPAGMATDIDDFASETQTELDNLQQDLLHRLVENPGSNQDFPPPNVRGVGIFLYLNGTEAQLQGLPARVDHEFEQDSRVISSRTTLQKQPAGAQYPYILSVQVESVAGVFGLSFGWSQTGLVPLPSP